MASHQTRPLTLPERMTYAITLFLVVIRALFTIPQTFRAVRKASWPVRRTLAVSFLRCRRPLVELPTHLVGSPTVGTTIKAVCQRLDETVSTSVVSCGDCPDAALHGISFHSTPNGPVLFYFHGGGYRNPIAGEGHVPVVLDCARTAGASKVIFLEYTLTPAGKFPTQLAQAARALDVVLSERNIRPAQLLMGGDSAGGNLALALLAHLKQPHPKVPPVKHFNVASEAFKGVFLISPWVTMRTKAASFAQNKDKDYLDAAGVDMFVNFWSPADCAWADPLRAGADFWASNVPVQKMVVTAGGFESIKDDIIAMTKLLEPVMGKRMSVVVAPAEVHVQCVVDTAIGLGTCRSLEALLEWFGNV